MLKLADQIFCIYSLDIWFYSPHPVAILANDVIGYGLKIRLGYYILKLRNLHFRSAIFTANQSSYGNLATFVLEKKECCHSYRSHATNEHKCIIGTYFQQNTC